MHVVGLFDDITDAQAVVRDLEAAGFDSNTIDLHIGTASGMVRYLTGVGVPETDAHAYAEAIQRGGSLVTVQTQTDAEADQAAKIMHRHPIVNIANRGQEYRQRVQPRFDEATDAGAATTTDRMDTTALGI